MSAQHTDARVAAYLEAVRDAVASVDPGRVDDIVAEIAEHLADAEADATAGGEAFDVERAISELGDPVLIASAVEPPAGAAGSTVGTAGEAREAVGSAWARVLSSPPVVILTIAALAVGILVSPLVIVIALVLVWCSPRWGVGDKIVATLANPLLLLFALPVLSLGGFGGWSSVVLASPLLAVYLVLRVRRGDGQRVLRVPRADENRIPRDSAFGRFDRRIAAGIATASAPFALLAVTVPALVVGDWATLPVSVALGAAALALGIVVLGFSTSWSLPERGIGIAAIAVFGVVLFTVVRGVVSSVPLLERCREGVCRTLPAELRDPAVLLDPVARWVLPIALFSAGWAAARFTAARGAAARGPAGSPAVAPVVEAGRRLPLIAAACSLAGAVAAPAVIAMSGGSALGAAFAAVGLAAWLAAAVIVQRSSRWSGADRWLTSLVLPAITWLALALFVADPQQMRELEYAAEGGLYDLAASSLHPAAEVVPVVAVIAGLVQLAIAIRLLGAVDPRGRRLQPL